MNDLYELRLYQVQTGRMDDMAERWHQDLSVLFQRHGVAPLGAWRAKTGPNLPLFVYLMHWNDFPSRQAAWAGFYGDPQWAEARTRTNAGSELVERYDLSFLQAIVPWSDTGQNGYTELKMINVEIGASAAARALVKDKLVHEVEQRGGHILGALECMTGPDLPAVVMLLSWPDRDSARDAQPLFESRPLGRATLYQLEQI